MAGQQGTSSPRNEQALLVSAPVPVSAIPGELVVERPAAGQLRVVEVEGFKALKFAFSTSDCTMTVLDIDTILVFPDGGKIIIPTLALRLVSPEPPALDFAGKLVEPQQLLASVGDVRLVDTLPALAASEAAGEKKTREESSTPAVQLPQLQQAGSYTPAPGARASASVAIGLSAGDSLDESNTRFARRVNFAEQQSSAGAMPTAGPTGTNPTTERTDSTDAVPQIVTPGPASLSFAENTSSVLRMQANISDPKATVSFAIEGGPDAALFAINATTGQITFVGPSDYETTLSAAGNHRFQLIVSARNGTAVDLETITVEMTDRNEAPNGATVTGMQLGEFDITGTIAGRITGNDPDAGSVLSYAFAPGTNTGGVFAIDALTGQITLARPDAIDFERAGVETLVIRITDQFGATFDQLVNVTIRDQNDAPVITLNGGGNSAALTVAENTSTLATILARDDDAGATLTYTITGGADAALFAINAATGVLTFVAPPNYEAPTDSGGNNVYDLIVTVSDGLGGSDTQMLSVTVTNANEAPVITSTATLNVDESSPAGMVIGLVSATDPDAGATLTFSFAPGGAPAGIFSIAANGTITLVNPALLDFVTTPSYDLTVRVTDEFGAFSDAVVHIDVTSNNLPPVITSNGGGATASLSVAENGTGVTTVTASDVDAGATLTYTITGGADAALFAINASTGVLTFIAPPDYEAPTDSGANNVYDLIVTVSDGLGGTDTQTLAVTVTNANEAPVITSNGGGATASLSVAENGTGVTTVTASDPDAGAT
ncbi:MAG: cadherin repeat domain-containing protein, partial [Proteobacteria bacterium]|nr:cadherin repeat domain-containing protein [Pseudomonadota bacterium]